MIAHPTGRLLGERDAYELDFGKVFQAARDTRTALEINSHPQWLDLNAVHVKRAQEMGVTPAVDTDSHGRDQFHNLEFGVAVARRGWCEKKNILNCLNLKQLESGMKKKRSVSSSLSISGAFML